MRPAAPPASLLEAKVSAAESELSLEEAIYRVSIIDCGNPRDPSSGARRRRRHRRSLQNS